MSDKKAGTHDHRSLIVTIYHYSAINSSYSEISLTSKLQIIYHSDKSLGGGAI